MDILYHVLLLCGEFLTVFSKQNSKNIFVTGYSKTFDYNELDAGVYYGGTNCDNAPENYCRAICMYSSENDQNDGIQVAFPVTSGKIYRRACNNSLWSKWFCFSDDETLFAGTAINSGDDLNDYTTPGIYKSQFSTQTATILNLPETIQSGFILLVFSASQTGRIQLIFPTAGGIKMYYRGSTTQGWQPWLVYQGNTIS